MLGRALHLSYRCVNNAFLLAVAAVEIADLPPPIDTKFETRR